MCQRGSGRDEDDDLVEVVDGLGAVANIISLLGDAVPSKKNDTRIVKTTMRAYSCVLLKSLSFCKTASSCMPSVGGEVAVVAMVRRAANGCFLAGCVARVVCVFEAVVVVRPRALRRRLVLALRRNAILVVGSTRKFLSNRVTLRHFSP